MIVAADLNRAVTRVGNQQRQAFRTLIQFDVARFGENLAGDATGGRGQRIGS